MAVHVATSTPNALLAAIKKAIDNRNVATWEYDADGDFTHTPPQWYKKAYLRPSTITGALTLTPISVGGVPTPAEIYGVYHGRFIEMLLAHFKGQFNAASAA